MLRFSALLFVTALTACAPPEKDPGLEAYEQLVAAVRRGDPARLWGTLTPESQAWLAESAGLAKDAPVEAVAAVLGVRPGWQFELELPEQAHALEAPAGAPVRVVEGPLAGRVWRIPTRPIDGVWRVDLAQAEVVPESPE